MTLNLSSPANGAQSTPAKSLSNELNENKKINPGQRSSQPVLLKLPP